MSDDRIRPEERRRNELYRQYYEELQRRYDTDRPVDCSVIVVNKAQKYVYSLLRSAHSSVQMPDIESRLEGFISYHSCVSVCVCRHICLRLFGLASKPTVGSMLKR